MSRVSDTIPISEARSNLPKLVELAGNLSKKTYITVKGKVKAAIVNARDLELMEETLAVLGDEKSMKAIKKGKKDVMEGKLVDWKDMKDEIGL